MKKAIYINKINADNLQAAINSNQKIDTCAEGECLYVFSAAIGADYEVSIEVVNQDGGPWINPILYKKHSEVSCLDPRYTLLGEYVFTDPEDIEIIVSLQLQNSTRFIMDKK